MAIFEGSFTNASTLKVGIVIARFNDLITNKILSGCLDCLKRHGLDTSELSNQVDIVWVPGSFELPIAAKTLMKQKSYDVVIALGAVIRGETSHYVVVISEASKGISQVSNYYRYYDLMKMIIFRENLHTLATLKCKKKIST